MANFRDWRSECSSSFSEGIVWLPWSYAASGEGINNPERVRAAVISPEVFSETGVVPAAGRLLSPEDSSSGPAEQHDEWASCERRYLSEGSMAKLHAPRR